MWRKLAIRLTKYAFSKAHLSVEDGNLLTGIILKELGALPLRDIIVVSREGRLLVNGKPLDMESARLLRESASAVLQNNAFKYIREQVLFNAVKIGVHKAEDPKQMFFARSAIWWGQQEDELLQLLAQSEGTVGSSPL